MAASTLIDETRDRLLGDPVIGGVHYCVEFDEHHRLILTPDAFVEAGETWLRICNDPKFVNTNHKTEVTPEGTIIMAPVQNYHGFLQAQVVGLLARHAQHGVAAVELGVMTPRGLFSADVAWVVSSRARVMFAEKYASTAPEICIEVESLSNSKAEFENKRDAYFLAGALECWEISRAGKVTFYNIDKQGEPIGSSRLVPMFPAVLS